VRATNKEIEHLVNKTFKTHQTPPAALLSRSDHKELMPHTDQKKHVKRNEAKMKSNRQQQQELRTAATIVMVDDWQIFKRKFWIVRFNPVTSCEI
jgi:hypothetical protein